MGPPPHAALMPVGHGLRVAVILPVLNEAGTLPATLEHLQRQTPDEIIVVDGGSTDATRAVAQPGMKNPPVQWRTAERGRARQMNAGAADARSDILLFLHADTRLPPGAVESVRAAVRAGHVWGRFDVRLDGPRASYRVIEWFMNRRSALTGIATGDQAIFVRRDIFEKSGGYPDIALMEDIALSTRLKRVAFPACLKAVAVTSARRWESGGIARVVLRMWVLRLLYWFGVAPARLARWYRA